MNEYCLAVCEDDDNIREDICVMCREILAEHGIEHAITAFSSAAELEELLRTEENPFDCLLLDIQMAGMSGMELAQLLRSREDNVSIIFITSCENYLREGYSVQPIHFLLKPVKREVLEDALRIDWRLNHKPKIVTLRVGSRTVSLKLTEILYIESQNHSVVVHKREASQSFTFSLSDMERMLVPGQFFRCHNSYLVNMEYVEEIGRTELQLAFGERIPIGRKYYKDFQSAFIHYMNQ